MIRDDETGEVKKDMEDLANRLTVIRADSVSDMDDAHYLTVINIAISEEKTLQIMTVYDRTVYELYCSFYMLYVEATSLMLCRKLTRPRCRLVFVTC